MISDDPNADLIELGTVSEDTKSGPFGVDEHRAGLLVSYAGLTSD